MFFFIDRIYFEVDVSLIINIFLCSVNNSTLFLSLKMFFFFFFHFKVSFYFGEKEIQENMKYVGVYTIGGLYLFLTSFQT